MNIHEENFEILLHLMIVYNCHLQATREAGNGYLLMYFSLLRQFVHKDRRKNTTNV